MEYRIEDNILWVKGKLDSSSAPEFEAAIARLTSLLTGQPPRAVLEFSGIESLTSAPLRAMLTLAKRLHAASGSVLVAAPSPIALEALKVSGFLRLQVFQIIGSLAELNPAPGPAPTSPPASPTPPPASPTPPPRQAQPREIEKPVAPAPTARPAEERTSPGLFRRFIETLCFWKR